MVPVVAVNDVADIDPFTSNVVNGTEVPMPTFPELADKHHQFQIDVTND